MTREVKAYIYQHYNILVDEADKTFVPQLHISAMGWAKIPAEVMASIERAIDRWTLRGYTHANVQTPETWYRLYFMREDGTHFSQFVGDPDFDALRAQLWPQYLYADRLSRVELEAEGHYELARPYLVQTPEGGDYPERGGDRHPIPSEDREELRAKALELAGQVEAGEWSTREALMIMSGYAWAKGQGRAT